MKSLYLFVEFWVGLVKLLWICLVCLVKQFLPVKKKDVSKEIVLITGAGSGIGRLMALEFAKLGAKLVLWDINQEANDAVRDEIKGMGGVAHSYRVDCSKKEEIYNTASEVRSEVGDVTVLVNNAGIVSGNKKFYDLPDKMCELTFQVNTLAHLWTIKAFVPKMKERNHGHVITIASGAGLFAIASLIDYVGSKFGAVGIHEALASELFIEKVDGVKTTLVCPYFINTGMFDGVKTRVPALLPILEPDYAVNKIMAAYHSDQYILLMPRILYVFRVLQSFLPKTAMLQSAEFFGANRAMDTFKGREKKD